MACGHFSREFPGTRYPEPDLEGPHCPWFPLAPCSHSMGMGPAKGRSEQMVLENRGNETRVSAALI